ncbi:hypothetical protein POTOM_047028 [Populus tomentosa]|uniref:Uncharacterized protein n=1 Tax=Populus tomentosa TaxID=118781 RepID=A0A8X7YFT1_POPTO|nr:hypothetical protein POTOM_047028 [Populus tomentosa]
MPVNCLAKSWRPVAGKVPPEKQRPPPPPLAVNGRWAISSLPKSKAFLLGLPQYVSEPEKWGYPNPADWKKILVYFFGTQQM